MIVADLLVCLIGLKLGIKLNGFLTIIIKHTDHKRCSSDAAVRNPAWFLFL